MTVAELDFKSETSWQGLVNPHQRSGAISSRLCMCRDRTLLRGASLRRDTRNEACGLKGKTCLIPYANIIVPKLVALLLDKGPRAVLAARLIQQYIVSHPTDETTAFASPTRTMRCTERQMEEEDSKRVLAITWTP